MRLDFGCYLPFNSIPEIFEKALLSKKLCGIYEITVSSLNEGNLSGKNGFAMTAKLIDFKGHTEELIHCNRGTRVILKIESTDSENRVRYINLLISSSDDHDPSFNTKIEPDESFDKNFTKDFFLIVQEIEEGAIEKFQELEASKSYS